MKQDKRNINFNFSLFQEAAMSEDKKIPNGPNNVPKNGPNNDFSTTIDKVKNISFKTIINTFYTILPHILFIFNCHNTDSTKLKHNVT